MELKIRTKEQQMIDAFKKYIKTKGNVTLDYSLEAYMQVALDYISSLEQENQELKKKLENCYCNRTDCSSRIKDSKRYDSLVQKYDKALMILANFWPPCEQDDFMDKNTDYCSINCGVDEEVFKKCWDKYIEQHLEVE